jgi:beta-lactamase regulating signal transducer with metallopeptidase domain
MHAIEALLNRPELERLGWVLLHFVWQGIIAAGLLATALFALRRASANARYFAACATLIAMAACLPATWLVMLPAAPTVTGSPSDPIARTQSGNTDRFAQMPVRPVTQRSQPEARPPMAAAEMNWQQRLAAYLPLLAVAWLAGVLALSLRLAIGWSAVHRLRRAASRPLDDSRQSILSRLSHQIGIRWPVKLLESSLVDVPTMIGWLRPVILWPPSVLAGLSIEQFEALLAHELAHVRRHDYLVNLVQTAIETLLFYHPAVWWVSSRIRQERESCCDDRAIATCGNRLSYARALATLEELRPRPRQLALAADGGHLLVRIRRIIGVPATRRSGSRHWLLGIAISATLCALVIALGISNFATGDEPPAKPVDPPPAKSIDTAKASELPSKGRPEAPKPGVDVSPTQATPINGKTVSAFESMQTGTLVPAFELMQTGPRLGHVAPQKPIEVRGQVIDDATNKPLASSSLQEGQFRPDAADLKRVVWSLVVRPSQADGRFTATINWDAGQRMRVVAAGYVPEPILAAPPKPGETKIDGLVIRIKRGRQVSGQVLDYQGKPVADAGLFVIGDVPGASLIKGGKALVGLTDGYDSQKNRPVVGWHEDTSVVRFVTDAGGRFTVDGISEAAHMIAVSCPAVDLQIVEAPLASQPQKDLEIRLRQPGKLIVHYDIDGAPDEAHFELTPEMMMTQGLSESQANSIENGAPTRLYYEIVVRRRGEWVIDSISPGDYHIWRKKDFGRNSWDTAYLDQRIIRIVSGKTTTVDFVRDTGARVSGQIVGLDREETWTAKSPSVTLSVGKPGETSANWDSRWFDKVAIATRTADGKPSDGRFITERLPPGQYTLDAQIIMDASGKFLREPLFGTASVTVPERGEPSPVRIELAKPRLGPNAMGSNVVSGNPWSAPVAGLQARLMFERAKVTNGTPIIATYLELRNVSESAVPLEVALDPSKIAFTVTDVAGKEVAQAGLPYDGAMATPGTLRLPHDSQLRLSISGNGAGIPKDQVGVLDLASSAVWVFKRGDVGAYYLRAKIAIPKADEHLWNGTIEIPDTRIPIK